MSSFLEILQVFLQGLVPVVELLVLTILYWLLLRVLRHTRAIFPMAVLVLASMALGFVNLWLNMPVLSSIANSFLRFLPLVVLVLFPEEIRRLLASPAVNFRRYTMNIRRRRTSLRLKRTLEESADELVKGVCCLTPLPQWRGYLRDHYHLDMEEERLSMKNTGALIAIEGVAGLDDFQELGVQLYCRLNYRLLRTIFYSGTALHDGGVILRVSRGGELTITAAGCRFPMDENAGNGPVHTRQNAVRGLAERTDAFVLMVSEETGSVLIPEAEERQRIRRLTSPAELREELMAFLLQSSTNRAARILPEQPSTAEDTPADTEAALPQK